MKRMLIVAAIFCLIIAAVLAIQYFSPRPILPEPDRATLVSFIYQGQEMADQLEEIDTNYLLQLLSRYECKRTLRSAVTNQTTDFDFVLLIKRNSGFPISILVSRVKNCLMIMEDTTCEIVYGEYLHEKLISLVQQSS